MLLPCPRPALGGMGRGGALAAALALRALVAGAQEQLYWLEPFSAACSSAPLVLDIPPTSAGEAGGLVPVIFRTAHDSLSFFLDVRSVRGEALVPKQRVFLDESAAARRLAVCEDYFLADRRSPAELPDTWAEARAAFGEVCESELDAGVEECGRLGAQIFAGQPAGDGAFDPAEVCGAIGRLLGGFRAPPSPRRLKTGGSSSSSGTSSGSSSASAASAGRYGLSGSQLGRYYSGGYTGTSSGFTGRAGFGAGAPRALRTPGLVAVAVGAGVGLGAGVVLGSTVAFGHEFAP